MPRGKPSAADIALLRCLAGRGVKVSESQLERWRAWGLIPSPVRSWVGKPGSASAYEQSLEQVADHVAAVAARMHRGADRELVAVALTADGWPVREGLTRAGYSKVLARWVEQFTAPMAGLAAADVDDEFSDIDAAAGRVVDAGGVEARRWERRLAARPDVLDGEAPAPVLRSAVAGLFGMILGREVSAETKLELAVASGLDSVAGSIAALEPDGQAPAGVDDVEYVIGGAFEGGPLLKRMSEALAGASIETLRAVAALVSLTWPVLAAEPVLAPLVKAFGSLDGDQVWVHGAAVALVTSMLADGSADADAMALFVAHTGTLSDTEGMRLTGAVAFLTGHAGSIATGY